MRRAQRREFPALKYIVYLNSSIIVAQDFKLMNDLLKYGLDVLYPKLQWTDKIQIIDMANKSEAPYI